MISFGIKKFFKQNEKNELDSQEIITFESKSEPAVSIEKEERIVVTTETKELKEKINKLNFTKKYFKLYINNKLYKEFATIEETHKYLKLIGYHEIGELFWKDSKNNKAIILYGGKIEK